MKGTALLCRVDFASVVYPLLSARDSMPFLPAVLAAILLGLPPGSVRAQEAVAAPFFGIHQELHFVTGGAIGIPLGSDGGPWALAISGGFDATNDFVEPAEWEYWEANVDLVLYGGDLAHGGLFLLGGFNLATVIEERTNPLPEQRPRSEETSVALNFGGGLGLVIGSVMPVLGMKFEIGKRHPFLVFFGLGFPLGRDD